MPTLDPMIQVIVSSGIALLFLFALVHKLRDWGQFRETLANYSLVPRVLVSVVAAGVVMSEAVVVAGNLWPATRATAALFAAGLLLAYAAAMAINLRRGRVLVDCGCAGFGQRQSLAWWMVRRNVVLAAIALLATWPVSARELNAADLFVIVCAIVSLAGLYLAHATLAGNRRYIVR